MSNNIGKYIVVFKENVTKEQIDNYKKDVNESGGEVTNEYSLDFLRGFAAKIPEAKLNEFKSFDDGIIDYIEPDGVVSTQ